MKLSKKTFSREYNHVSAWRFLRARKFSPYKSELDVLENEALDWINSNESIDVISISTHSVMGTFLAVTVWYKNCIQ